MSISKPFARMHAAIADCHPSYSRSLSPSDKRRSSNGDGRGINARHSSSPGSAPDAPEPVPSGTSVDDDTVAEPPPSTDPPGGTVSDSTEAGEPSGPLLPLSSREHAEATNTTTAADAAKRRHTDAETGGLRSCAGTTATPHRRQLAEAERQGHPSRPRSDPRSKVGALRRRRTGLTSPHSGAAGRQAHAPHVALPPRRSR